MKRIATFALCGAIALSLSLGSCSKKNENTQNAQTTPDTMTNRMAETTSQQAQTTALRAVANLEPTQGNNVRGTITFTQQGEGVQVSAQLTGLTPGKHGIHIHQNGDCSAPDASSAGDHFNPTNKQHAGPTDMDRHLGDMGNIDADSSGNAQMQYVDRMLALSGPNSIIGKAVVVHAKEDDMKTQPSGNSGARVACGVINSESATPGGQ